MQGHLDKTEGGLSHVYRDNGKQQRNYDSILDNTKESQYRRHQGISHQTIKATASPHRSYRKLCGGEAASMAHNA